MKNRVKTNIIVPQYAELELSPRSFALKVTLPITKEVYDIMKPLNIREKNMRCSVFYNGRHYAQMTREYPYTISPDIAVQRHAPKQLACLQAIICRAKVVLLKERISQLEKIFMEED